MKKYVFLTIDLEEFDIPEEFNQAVDFDTQMSVSSAGMEKLLSIFDKYHIQTTIFCTANYAQNNPQQIRKIVNAGHELASHGFFHSTFEPNDLLKSKQKLEEIANTKVSGFRMPRLRPVNYDALIAAGYTYDSSLNPCYLPGRYNHLDKSRVLFKYKNFKILPTSVSKYLRIPLFWLGFKNYPFFFYEFLANKTVEQDKYLNLYFHPWEFEDLRAYQLPEYIKKIDNQALIERLEKLIQSLQKNNCIFVSIEKYLSLQA